MNDIDLAKQVSIVTVITKLGMQIRNNKISCPFHKENTPSLQIYPKTNSYYCWGCNSYGNVITFVMNYYKITLPEAIDYLLKGNVDAKYKPPLSTISNKSQIDFRYNAMIYKYFFDNLILTDRGRDYLKNKRGLSDDIINKYKIKSIDDYKPLYKKLIDRFGMKKLINSGLVGISNRTNNPYFIFFVPSVIFPYTDKKNNIIYFTSRSYDKKSFTKLSCIPQELFYGNIFKREIVVVESVLCGLSYEQLSGNDNFIAITSININVIKKLINDFDNRLIFMLDNDEMAELIYKKLKKQYNIKIINPQTFAKQFNITEPVKDINDILQLKLSI